MQWCYHCPYNLQSSERVEKKKKWHLKTETAKFTESIGLPWPRALMLVLMAISWHLRQEFIQESDGKTYYPNKRNSCIPC